MALPPQAALSFLLILQWIIPTSGFLTPSSLYSARFRPRASLFVTENTPSVVGEQRDFEQSLLQSENPKLSLLDLIESLTKTCTEQGPQQALQLLQQTAADDQSRTLLESCHYKPIISAWCGAQRIDEAEEVLAAMEDLSIKPDHHTYHMLMQAMAQSPQSSQRVFEMLGRMEQQGIQPTTADYNLVLNVFARQGAASKAEKLLKRMVDCCRMLEQQDVDSSEFAPDLQSYNLLLDAHAKSAQSGAGDRAREILTALQRQYDDGECEFRPDARTYGAVIQAVLRSEEDPSAALTQIHSLLDDCKSTGVKTDSYLQSMLLDAYASCSDPAAAEKAEQLLEAMEHEGSANDVAYNTVLKVWKYSKRRDAPERAEAILQRMEERKCVGTISYTTFVGILANKGDTSSARRATEILTKMHASYEEGNTEVKPNVQTYNGVMHAWVRCGDVKRAELILSQLEELQESDPTLAPNVVSYSTVMGGWARSSDNFALQHTEESFQRMVAASKAGNKGAEPNLFSYVTLINAYARSRDPEAAQKAEDVFFDLYKKYRNGKSELMPNTQILTTVVDCWQKSGRRDCGEKAETLLKWAIKEYEEHCDDALLPNEYTFASAIVAWGKSRKLGKAIHARTLLKLMVDMYESGKLQSSPNTHCFTAVIHGCAYCENDEIEKSNALKIAISTYKALLASKYGEPNQVTFSSLLTALRNLLPACKERSAAVQTVFKSAAKDGRVDDLVVRRLQTSLSTDELRELVSAKAVSSDGQVVMDELPREWTRNVEAMHRSRHSAALRP